MSETINRDAPIRDGDLIPESRLDDLPADSIAIRTYSGLYRVTQHRGGIVIRDNYFHFPASNHGRDE